jgi:glycosyltransferase involved in cell wall biosynthesis
MGIPVLIPAYKPTENLLNIAESLISLGCQNIIIVNDGSGPEFAPIFEKLRVLPQCHVLEHAVNLGKGRALKTGFNHIYLKFREARGILKMS